MEEERAAALYDELTRKGSGAARFKQGLGFSSISTSHPSPTSSAPPSSSSSFLSQFVKASNSTSEKAAPIGRVKQKSQIENIQNKLRKKDPTSIEPQYKDRDKRSDRERDIERHSREIRSTERTRRTRRSPSRSCSSDERDHRHRRRRRSRSRSYSDEDRKRSRRRSSPSYRGTEGGRVSRETRQRSPKKAKLIQGYDNMMPAERVKAKMKSQLSEVAAKDTKIGTGSGWERFEFNKDAPLDNEDDEIEGAHDDTKVVNQIGQTFRFSNVQARREEEIKSAHDEAMFGVPAATHDNAMIGASLRSPSVTSEGAEESENENKQIESNNPSTTGLFSDKLLAKKQGTWRDRAPRDMK